MKAEDYIKLFNREKSKAANFMTLYQNTADVMFPRENKITKKTTDGEEITTNIPDPTAVMAQIDMSSGLSINLFPPGQKFYNITMADRKLNENANVRRMLGLITEISHEKRASSNFMLQANETLRSISAFGTGNLYSEYVPGIGLNYRDYDVSQYVFMENSKGRVDTMLMKFPYTARQAYQEFGDKAGESVLKQLEDGADDSKEFEFIHVVRPREERNVNLKDNLNMPFESVFVSLTDKIKVKEGGFEEFPYSVVRWTKSSNEIWGRGQGTFALPYVRQLQKMMYNTIECSDKHVNPPLQVLESFEGELKTFPGALNYVSEMNSIAAIQQNALGNFPISKDILEMWQDMVRKLHFNDVFIQLRDLKGDRRNELEIRARLSEGLQRLGPPIGRLQEEWLDPMVTRDINLLIRNGEIPPLPPEMQGQYFKIEYIGRLAMELKSQQARGWQTWVRIGAELEQIAPGTLDNVNLDGGFRRLGETLGVSVDDMNTAEDIESKRQARAQQQQAMMQAQILEGAANAYGKTNKAAEEGSLAKAVMQ